MDHWVQSIVSQAGRSWQMECRWEEAVLCLLWRWISLTSRTSLSRRFCLKLAGENLSRKARLTGRSEPPGKRVLLSLPVPLCHQTGGPYSQCSSTVYYRQPENSKTNSHWQSIVTCGWKRPVLGTCPSSSEHQRARTAFLWLSDKPLFPLCWDQHNAAGRSQPWRNQLPFNFWAPCDPPIQSHAEV